MTRKEAMRRAHQETVLMELGFTFGEAAALRRISITLHRWHELTCGDCNGYIERDEKTGKPFYVNCNSRYVSANDPRARHAVADRETGAKKRLEAILSRRTYIGKTASQSPISRSMLTFRPIRAAQLCTFFARAIFPKARMRTLITRAEFVFTNRMINHAPDPKRTLPLSLNRISTGSAVFHQSSYFLTFSLIKGLKHESNCT